MSTNLKTEQKASGLLRTQKAGGWLLGCSYPKANFEKTKLIF